ncbi:amino acid/amide ABC transporter membrane protein 2 (HAAT family) [Roseinatronobacter thiooxidans]|uniref:Amino acid/amide ABC transporter membrane protein 2 (HAAT family) n=1 Tax=Roseinatronobacter thiooxidans TaxID=121821 RepID=A0A2W7PYH0_9RHOB|nr:branched-chain amino acid ABC transporter permease [Roseinatronobacter thiooxidans]PZX36957.1 amino acid/amide ABC transporter membrane protein 2 (HAAT family) [Roseinatronobacter thiooxidans]
MFRHTPLRYAALIILFSGALFTAFTAGYFGMEILTEILILAILVLALDLVAGFGGMVSLAHGALMGLGAYAFVALATKAGLDPWVAASAAVAITAGTGWVIGAICARSHGIYFIMATLAFGQMGYSYFFEQSFFGGDDGMVGPRRFDLGFIGINLNDSRSFALFCLAILGVIYLVAMAILRSGLGRSLTGVTHNEKRMRALGLNVWRVKADVFGLSGAMAGIAGVLAAQHIMFISPKMLHWTVSGEALVVVILGGLGTLVGPLVGAVAFVVMKHELSHVTTYWHLIVGLVLIAVVMSRANGIFGFIEARFRPKTDRMIQSIQTRDDAKEIAKDA